MKAEDFVHLHVHTEYSLLDGAIPIERLFESIKKMGMSAVAMTDHGNMFGAIKFYRSAEQWGIKPIIGCEVYIAPGGRRERVAHGVPDASFHAVLLVKDERGYKNLMKLCTAAYLEGFYYKPRIDKELLSRHAEGLIFLSGCIKGEIPYYILKGEMEKVKECILFFQQLFDKDFYFEIQDNGLEEQRVVINALLQLSRECGVPIVATNDVHYLHKEDAEAHDVLLCIQTQKRLDEKDRLRFSTEEFYLKDKAEMQQLFSNIPQALSNTIEIAEKCNLSLKFDTLSIPKVQIPEGMGEDEFLRRLCTQGAKRRYGQISSQVHERLEEELRVIKKTRFAPYFLIVWDIVHHAKESGIPVGPGRGSCAGSLVAYTLGITDIDPLKYGLLFERFLTEERVSMPDIDIDFCDQKREEVLEYVRRKYGEDRVAHIITFGTLLARAVIRDVGRALNIPYKEVDRLAKLIPPHTSLDEALLYVKELSAQMAEDPQKRRLLQIAKSLEGLVRHPSTHAAGVVISKEPLTESVPLYKDPKSGVVTTQYSKDSIEAIGLLKMDFLGLRTLTLIESVVQMIKEKSGVELDVSNIPLDDAKTYSLLSAGETLGVFQLESVGMREILKKVKPQFFEDLVAVLALHRPGPLQSGMIDEFVKNKQKGRVSYLHSALEPILKETYGVIVYQEQVMQIAKELAGFSLTQADELRKAMGKKIREKMEKARSSFLEGAKSRGIEERVAEQIFELMSKFAEYGFNKSHSAAYALISYRTAYLKAHYPLEFMASLLTSEMNDTDKIALYVKECERMQIKVLLPDINESEQNFTITEQGHIRYALGAIKNVGTRAIQSILEARRREEFLSFHHFLESVDSRLVNKKVVEYLIKSGSFDALHPNRAALFEALERFSESASKGRRALLQPSLFSSSTTEALPAVPQWSHAKRLFFEKEALGLYLSEHPLTRHKREIQHLKVTNLSQILQTKEGSSRIVCIINSIKRKATKNKKMMAFLSVEDLSGRAEVLLFPEIFESVAQKLGKDKVLFIEGRVEYNGEHEEPRLVAEDVLTLDEAYKKYANLTHIYIDIGKTNELLLQKLRTLLDEYKGESPLHLHFKKDGRVQKVLQPSVKIRVCEQFLDEVERLFGRENVSVEVR